MNATRFAPVPFVDVKLTGRFWCERVETVLTKTIPSQHSKLAEWTILDALKMPSPAPPLVIPRHANGFSVQVFWDSDVGKWIEAASYALAHRRDADIEAKIEAIVDNLEKAQAPDGYLNSWYQTREPENRFTNLRDNHELYNAGHLLEGAIAYFQTTGRRRFLDVMERYIDLIGVTFGTGAHQRPGYDGHPEIELALIKLYRLTGEKKRLDLAAYFVNQRGAQPHYFDEEAVARGTDPKDFTQKTHEYSQSHLPVRQQKNVVGHAVRAMYLYTAMADLAKELGEESLKRACETLWDDVILTKMYVTAGLGPSEHNEGFTKDYDLPNATAYAETCASVALIFWAQRMLHLDFDGIYADILETALYNGALSGLSRDGVSYFYANPLESDGTAKRWTWHNCPCCTMNVSRLVASVAGYFVSVKDDGAAFHIYGGSEFSAEFSGVAVKFSETSNYPWDGVVSIKIDPLKPVNFGLSLRIPGWCLGASLSVNGQTIDVAANSKLGYVTVARAWQAGDVITLDLPMPPEKIYAHPNVSMNAGRVALQRGPLVYCVEEMDHPGGAVQRFRLPRGCELSTTERAELFDGIVMLESKATSVDPQEFGTLYRNSPPLEAAAKLTALPYFLWNNRGQGSMLVWIAESTNHINQI
ncbi:MAG: beta-L-arabinofuranosidase domain-containing protein [Rhizobiaceae bacterium]